jgi:hypothetical protein
MCNSAFGPWTCIAVTYVPLCFQVNPAESRVDINDGKWEQKDRTEPPQRTAASSTAEHDKPDTVALSETGPPDLPGNPCTRKSSKAKRVKSYLKKCKDVALGNSSGGHTEDQERVSATERDKHEGSRVRNSKRRSNSGNREVSGTSWYVAPDVDPSPSFVSVVEVVPQEQTDETASDNCDGKTVETATEQRKVSSASRSGRSVTDDVLDSRTEGGTCVEFMGPEDGRSVSSCVAQEDGVLEDCTSLCVPTLPNCTEAERNAPQAPEVSAKTSQLR